MALLRDLIGSLDPARLSVTPLHDRVERLIAHAGLSDGSEYQEALSLATLVQEIVWHGERESEACRSILESFAGYLRSRAHTLGQLELPR